MSERVNKEKQSSKTDEATVDDAPANVQNEELSESTSDLLDEIDDVLEENAEEFVRSYVQKGGQ